MAKPPNYTVGARRSSRVSNVCSEKKSFAIHIFRLRSAASSLTILKKLLLSCAFLFMGQLCTINSYSDNFES